jgi:hypothetical protein
MQDYRIKWRVDDRYSWFVRKLTSEGAVYGEVSDFVSKSMASFSGTLRSEELKTVDEYIKRLIDLGPCVESHPPNAGVIATVEPPEVIAIFPTGSQICDDLFKCIIQLIERRVREFLLTDALHGKIWYDLLG